MEGGGCTRSGVLGVGMEAEGMEAEGMEAELDAVSATDHDAATSTADASVPRSHCGVDGGVASAAPTAARTGAAARGPSVPLAVNEPL